jgi:hypothetical protein
MGQTSASDFAVVGKDHNVPGEFFAARPEHIDDRLVEDGRYERLPTVEAKTLSAVMFATLGEILGVGTHDDLVERAGPWRDAESGEAGVLRVPPEIRDALATANELDAIAERWAATDELEEWPPEDVRHVLLEVKQLARDARASDFQLWYWWSL